MKKSEILDAGKQLAKIYFKRLYNDLDPDKVVIIGLKEYTDQYIMIFGIEENYNVLCQIYYNKNTRKIKTEMFEKMDN